jgi:hypothetical protein
LVIIGDSALRETQLVSVVIPASVTSIGFLSLASRGLTSVTFGAGSQLSTIGGDAFQSTKFSSITIPESVTSIASTAFQLNTDLISIVFNGTIPAGWPWSAPANVQVSGKVNCGTSGYFTISSNSVTSNDLCRGSVTIPEGVVGIGAHAFDHDVDGSIRPNVETLTISSSVLTIGNFAFRKSKLTELVIPNNVTSIGTQSFIFSEEITSIVIGSGITAIPDNAFDALIKLNSLTLPSTLTSIGGYAFWNTQQLTTITIPDGVHTIAEHAFGDPPVGGRTINYCGNASLTGYLVTERTIRNTSACTPAPPLS